MGYLSPPPSPLPVVVQKDVRWSRRSDYENRTEAYRRENREVRLHECRSACTLALSLPNVCVYPDAKLKFHQAYNEQTREADLGVSQKLFDSYPAAVRARLGVLTRQYKVLSGSELIALGVRGCGGENRVIIATRKSAPPPVPANPLSEIARNVRMAVANALARPKARRPRPSSSRSPTEIRPPALARLAGDAKARAAKTRLRRPRSSARRTRVVQRRAGAQHSTAAASPGLWLVAPGRARHTHSHRRINAYPRRSAHPRRNPLSSWRTVAGGGSPARECWRLKTRRRRRLRC